MARSRTSRYLAGVAITLALTAAGVAAAATTTPYFPPAGQLALPAGAGGTQIASLDALDCPASGDCIGVGGYRDGSGDGQAMIAAETNGSWAQAGEYTELPSGADADPGAAWTAISCPAAGDCATIGDYTASGVTQTMTAAQTGGSWSAATQLTPPANALAGGPVAGTGIACTAAGDCVAAGHYDYEDTADGDPPDEEAMVATQSGGGAWSASELTALPSNAAPSTGLQQATLDAVSCANASDCVAVGDYTDTNGSQQAMVASGSGGSWQASELALPSDAAQYPALQYAYLESVACTAVGDCVAVGGYTDNAENEQAMVASESGGSWSAASEVTLPAGAATGTAVQHALLDSVSCPASGECAAGGQYTDSSGSLQAMTLAGLAGVWQLAHELSLPSGATSAAGAQDAYVDALACTSFTACVAGGSYAVSGSDDETMVTSSVPALLITTTSLPRAVGGSHYSASLTAVGGSGSETWSLSSGALPHGLTLDSSTGVVSGKPSALGSASFTITASDPGPPAQQASAALSITVAAPPRPRTKLERATINAVARSAIFKFKAKGDETRFQCALVRLRGRHKKPPRPHYSRCKSPKRYTHLKPGSYVFYVRAVGLGGADKTPAKHAFTIG